MFYSFSKGAEIYRNYLCAVRKLLLPFSWVYSLITAVRNLLFQIVIIRSVSFEIPLIGIGNLRVGGTGKTPMIEYVIDLLKTENRIATLSRGYGRKTTGFLLATSESTANEIGDEPCQVKQKYEDIDVVVCADRVLGVKNLIKHNPKLSVVLLDDVFQHRRIKPGLMILLSAYDDLYVNDHVLPAGMLREHKCGANRADIIVVTKCPKSLSNDQRRNAMSLISPAPYQKLFFAYEDYGIAYCISSGRKLPNETKRVILVTGIATVASIIAKIEADYEIIQHFRFNDHHVYTRADLDKISASFIQYSDPSLAIITTEKDATRLKKYITETTFKDLSIYALPVKLNFQNSDKPNFNKVINEFVRSN